MYGIEYSTFASLIQNEDLNENKNEKFTSTSKNESINVSNLDFSSNTSESLKASNTTDFFLNRLQSLSECPDYLIPKLTYNNSSISNIKKNDQTFYTDDFILLSEFSEIEGPKPLLTIPTDGGTGFDKNQFSLHLMCVDFHSHSHHHNQNENSKPKFSFTHDTSIINYWDSGSSMVTACIQHFTLYDIEARGFVRPFCLAYISYDQKPFGFFEDIKEKFLKITDLFKKSNYNLFRTDLENKYSDLKFTRELFLKWSDENLRTKLASENQLDNRTFSKLNSSYLNEVSKNLQLNTIEQALNEQENILETVVNELKLRKWLKDKRTINYNLKSVSISIDSFMSHETRQNRSLTYPLNSQDELNIQIDRNLRKPNENSYYNPKICQNILIGNANLDNLNYEYDNKLESNHSSLNIYKKKSMKRLHQLCTETARQAINELRLMHRSFSSPYYMLKFKKITQKTSNFNKSDLFWSITSGDVILADFSTGIDTSNFNKKVLEQKLNSFSFKNNENTLVQTNQTALNECSVKTQFYSPLPERTIYLDALATCNQSNKKIDIKNSNKTDTSYSWSNLEQFLKEDEDEKDLENELDHDDESPNYIYSNNEILYEEEEISNPQELIQKRSREENEYDFVNSLLTIDYRPYNQFNLSTNSLALSLSSSSVGLYYKALNSLKFQSCLTDKLIQIQEFNFEETLKKLFNSLSPNIFPHLLYSLLTGRPVICVSRYCSELSYLQSVIDCLSNFLPNSLYCLNSLTTSKSSHQSVSNPKFTSSPNQKFPFMNLDRAQLRIVHERKPIRLNDLKYCKLFGLSLLMVKDECCSNDCNDNLNHYHNSNIHFQHKHKHFHKNSKHYDDADILLIYIPITIRNYVSILDLDKLTFTGPKYTGNYLQTCIQKCKQMQQDSIIYLYLLSSVFNFYVRISFLYNYSILFENSLNETQSLNNPTDKNQTDFMNTSVQISTSNEILKSYKRKMSYQYSTDDNGSVLNKRDRILRYYCLMSDSDYNYFNNRSKIDLSLLKTVLSSISPNFDSSDLKIVSYLLKSLRIKQLYIYKMAIHKKELKDVNKLKNLEQKKNGPPLIQISNDETREEFSNTVTSFEIHFPLLVEFEEIHLFTNSKKG